MFKVFLFILGVFLFLLTGGDAYTSGATDQPLIQTKQKQQFFLRSTPPLHQNGTIKRKEQATKNKNLPEYNGDKVGNKRIYHLTVDYKTVNFTGRKIQAMAINDSLPAPTLYFKEGETAEIHVNNKMEVESSIHWHGILLPNFPGRHPLLNHSSYKTMQKAHFYLSFKTIRDLLVSLPYRLAGAKGPLWRNCC